MAFDDIIKKLEQTRETPRIEIVDRTLYLGRQITATDFAEPIKKIKDKTLSKIFKDIKEMNLYRKGWRFQFGTSKEWAGLCSATPSKVYESKKNKNLFVSLDIVKGDDNWEKNMKSTIYHEVAHAIVRELFYYPESPSNLQFLNSIDTDHIPSKGHGSVWRLICDTIKEKDVVCTQYYTKVVENNYFKNFRYFCTICGDKGYGNSKFFATRCTKCKSPVIVEKNII